MSIQSADIQFRLSGGAANANPDLSLGGAKSTSSFGTSVFDDVKGPEAAVGRVEYRGAYVVNTHATLTLTAAVAWLNSNTPSAATDIAIGLGTSALNGVEQTIANETTAPVGVTFFNAPDTATGLVLGDIPPGGSRFVWARRTVGAGAGAIGSDPFILRVEGDTL